MCKELVKQQLNIVHIDMTKDTPTKLLKDYHLGEEIAEKDLAIFFGELGKCFNNPVKLVAVQWTIQDSDGVQMDYSLKHKDYIEHEEDEDDLN